MTDAELQHALCRLLATPEHVAGLRELLARWDEDALRELRANPTASGATDVLHHNERLRDGLRAAVRDDLEAGKVKDPFA